MIKVILAEKSDEAEKYAKAFQQHTLEKNGVWAVSDPEFGQARIVHAQGHLTQLDMPGAYKPEWKKWNLKNLPIIPEHFHEHILQDKGRSYLFKTIKREIDQAEEVIIGTDGDREGENIAYSILRMIPGAQRKVTKRIWQNSTTKNGIRKALKNLRSASETRPYANEARARQKSDWLIGMNMSRLATLKMLQDGYKVPGGFPVGRVQTAITSLVVENDQAIKRFRKQDFWQLELVDQAGIKYRNAKKFTDEAEAKKALATLQEQSMVKDFQVEEKTKSAPKLLNLLEASAIAKTKWGYTSAKTLSIIQSLYDRGKDLEGWISYPRTEIKYITDNEFSYLSRKIKEYQQLLGIDFPVIHQEARKKYVSNTKTKEHTALIPTEVLGDFTKMSEEQKNVYRLITLHTILMFAGDEKFQTQTIVLQNGGYQFKNTRKQVLDPGYTQFLNEVEEGSAAEPEDDSDTNTSKNYEVGQHIFTEAKIIKGTTKPPKRLTEQRLLRTILPKYQIGTPATMAPTLELLKKHDYIVDKNDGFYPTAKGIAIVEFLFNTPFVDPETTLGWEKKLKLIGEGKKDDESFVTDTISLVENMVEHYLKRSDFKITTLEKDTTKRTREVLQEIGTCPACKKGAVEEVEGEGKNGHYHMFACDNAKCKFIFPTKWATKHFSGNDVKQFILDGKTEAFTFTSKNNKELSGYLTLEKKKVVCKLIKN